MNKQRIKNFWQKRYELFNNGQLDSLQCTTLTSDAVKGLDRKNKEVHCLNNFINLIDKKDNWLELGCGIGRMSFELSKHCSQLFAIDYIAGFIDVARDTCKTRGCNNINFINGDANCFDKIDCVFDCIFTFGLFCCLTDEDYFNIINKINYSKIPYVMIKESVGTFGKFAINKFSEELNHYYEAIYRYNLDVIMDFEKIGYKLKKTEVIEKHRKETQIQQFLFCL